MALQGARRCAGGDSASATASPVNSSRTSTKYERWRVVWIARNTA